MRSDRGRGSTSCTFGPSRSIDLRGECTRAPVRGALAIFDAAQSPHGARAFGCAMSAHYSLGRAKRKNTRNAGSTAGASCTMVLQLRAERVGQVQAVPPDGNHAGAQATNQHMSLSISRRTACCGTAAPPQAAALGGQLVDPGFMVPDALFRAPVGLRLSDLRQRCSA
jgi:hypothetical protein